MGLGWTGEETAGSLKNLWTTPGGWAFPTARPWSEGRPRLQHQPPGVATNSGTGIAAQPANRGRPREEVRSRVGRGSDPRADLWDGEGLAEAPVGKGEAWFRLTDVGGDISRGKGGPETYPRRVVHSSCGHTWSRARWGAPPHSSPGTGCRHAPGKPCLVSCQRSGPGFGPLPLTPGSHPSRPTAPPRQI